MSIGTIVERDVELLQNWGYLRGNVVLTTLTGIESEIDDCIIIELVFILKNTSKSHPVASFNNEHPLQPNKLSCTT